MSMVKVQHTQSAGSCPSWTTGRITGGTLFALATSSAGIIMSVAAYGTLLPTVAAICVFATVQALLLLTPLGGTFERRMFVASFSVSWFMSGVAALYAEKLGDPSQLVSDASTFYQLAASPRADLTLADLRVLTEGAGAVYAWRKIYEFADMLGLGRERHVGVLVNVLAVPLTGVLMVKTARDLYGPDPARQARLVLLVSACGLYWLFASMHLRDAAILLGIAAMLLFWVRYLVRRRTSDLVQLMAATALGLAFIGMLRTEFVIVPLAMLLAGLVAMVLFDRSRGARRLVVYGLAIASLSVFIAVAAARLDEFLTLATRGFENYSSLATQEAGADSLGYRYITSAPILLRILLGSIYLFLFPVPFWVGFQLVSVYNLFKSCNVLFFYLFTPLLAYAVWSQIRYATRRSTATMFLLFVAVGCTAAIAGTSLESRHFGVFLPAMMLLAISPPLHEPGTASAVTKLTFVYLGLVALLHLAWIAIKLQ